MRAVRRRELIILLGTAMTAPLAARAQQKTMPVIGILGLGGPENPAIALNLAGFRDGLRASGFLEGQNVAIEYRWAHDDETRLPSLAAELVARKVDVIVTEGGMLTALAAKAATTTIPVVFHTSDAIADGMVTNLAHPGSNLTGVSLLAPELFSKQFELLAELVPQAKTIAVLIIPKNQITDSVLRQIEETAGKSGVKVHFFDVDWDHDLDAVFATLSRLRVGGIVTRANATFADKLVGLTARDAIPAVYGQRAFAIGGGLLSYGASIPAVYVAKGRYTGKILRGEKPADLPVEQPTRFELVVNLKTAKALGLSVPPSILARADEVIE
jgi:putative ABC transport system substrate-binding protein